MSAKILVPLRSCKVPICGKFFKFHFRFVFNTLVYKETKGLRIFDKLMNVEIRTMKCRFLNRNGEALLEDCVPFCCHC